MQINLNGLQINDEQLEIMFNRIKKKDKVTKLNLSDNDFTKLPNSIIEFSSLEYLSLGNCKNLVFLEKLEKVSKKIYLKGSGITEEYVREFKPWLLEECKWN